jgi:GNAT superfamily N-acetyltransferase
MVAVVPASVEDVLRSGLIEELDADLRERYPGEPVNGIDPEAFRLAGGYFVLAQCDARPVGCGAFRPHDPGTVEIKRMFVLPEFRGRGVARSILAALEAEARRRGYRRGVLETGVRQPEAIALYRACGYAEIGAFGPYVGSDRSVCFGKALSQ